MKRPKIWAHRGASGYLPENTIVAFERAIQLGADGIELDIHKTADNQIVVIHDEKINRTSNGRGKVKSYTLEELRRYNYNATQRGCEHADIPTMGQVFDLIQPTNLTINIELKNGVEFYEDLEADILKMTKEYEMLDRVIFSSFNHYSIMKIKELEPKAATGFLYSDGPLDMPDYGRRHGVDALHPAFYNLKYPGFVEEAHEAGLAINTWTVNTQDNLHKACKLGVDGIITNFPDLAKEIVDTYSWDK